MKALQRVPGKKTKFKGKSIFWFKKLAIACKRDLQQVLGNVYYEKDCMDFFFSSSSSFFFSKWSLLQIAEYRKLITMLCGPKQALEKVVEIIVLGRGKKQWQGMRLESIES